MANEAHDPWALLREATAYLDDVVRSAPEKWKWTDEQREANDLMHRIDAALAAHDAVPPSEEKVEWLSLCDGQENRLSLADGTRLYACSHGDGHWGWSVNRPSSYGYANTLDEAKSAAIAAARGMK